MGTGGRVSKNRPTGKRPSGTKQSITLNDAVKWNAIPTPTAGDSKNAANKTAVRKDGSNHHSGTALVDYVRMWPTPRSTDGTKGSRTEEGSRRELERGKNMDLGMVVKLFPTPTATDGKGAGKTGSLRDRLDYAAERGATKSNEFDSPPPTGGRLNPQWVSWLMGFPVDWCDLPGESQPESQTESTSCDASATP
jgi:hypothetical protein